MSDVTKTKTAQGGLASSSLASKLEHLGVEVQSRSRIAEAYLLLDCSGSMAGSKLRDAVAGAQDFCAEATRSGYRAGIIVFSDQARLICEATDDSSRATQQLSAVASGGSTNIADAILLGANVLLKNARAVRSGVLVLFTDGQPDNASAAIRAADDAKSRGIQIICRGTEDADREFLTRLASGSHLAQVGSTVQLRQLISGTVHLLPKSKDNR